MDANTFKTYSARPKDIDHAWYVVDASDQIVGRLASRIASVLRGKHNPRFTPHMDAGDFVVVVNAEKVRLTGDKETAKEYFRYSGYPGGERFTTVEKMRASKPEFILRNAVRGMMPKGPLGRRMLKKLKVYAGPLHPHAAQQPKDFPL